MIEVILMERIERLGTLGQVVKVRPGYARNYLLPQKKAMRATKTNIAFFEKQRAVLEAQNSALRATAEAEAKKLEGLHVMLIRQASDSGQLYGSVTSRDVAEAATEAGYKIERRCVEIVTPIKTIGLSELRIKLHPEVVVKITINVARTEDEGKLQEQRGAAANVKAESAPEASPTEAAPEAAA